MLYLMALPIIFNLCKLKAKADGTQKLQTSGLRRLAFTETQRRREIKKGRNWKMEQTQTTPKATGTATRLIRTMLSLPLNQTQERKDFFCVCVFSLGYTFKELFSPRCHLFLSCQQQRISISTVFRASN